MNLFFSVHSVAWVPLVPTHLCQEGEGEKHTCVEEILARGTDPQGWRNYIKMLLVHVADYLQGYRVAKLSFTQFINKDLVYTRDELQQP